MDNKPESGWSFLIFGGVAATLGGLWLLVVGTDAGVVTALALVPIAAGGLLAQIGAVAVGVTVGMRRAAALDRD